MINTLIIGALSAALAAPASTNAPDGWQAFAGCWRADNAPLGAMLCVVPEGAGARMIELQDGKITRELKVVTDQQQRPVSQEGCSGTESGRWSADGERVFLNTDMTCTGAIDRKASAVFALLSRYQWVSIQAVTVGKEGGTTATRYTEVPDADAPAEIRALWGDNRLARQTARYAAARALDLDDVREAVSAVEPRAVETLLLAREQPFSLNARNLLALADAGVPTYVIDAMVAITHPDVFRVEETVVPSRVAVSDTEDFASQMLQLRSSRYSRCNSYSFDPWVSAYDALCSRGAFSGYSPWGDYSQRDYYNRPIIIVRGSDDDRISGGKATKNGYSRGASDGTTRAQPRDTRSTPSIAPSVHSTPSTSSSSGESSGSSGSGRTAKPKT